MTISAIKSSIIKCLVRSLRRIPYINKYIYTFSRSYIDGYRYFSYDFYENGEFRLIQKFHDVSDNEDIVFFDVGANIGKWSAYFLKTCSRSTGHVFEMCKGTYDNLKQQLSDSSEALSINHKALSNKEGTISYRYFGDNSGVNTTVVDSSYFTGGEVLETVVTTGHAYCHEHGINHINFLKIDVEGAEYSVLEGFRNLIEKHEIDVIQFEYGYSNGDVHTLMKDFFRFFELYGYRIGRLTPNGVQFKEFQYSDNDFNSGPNYVACVPKYVEGLSDFT